MKNTTGFDYQALYGDIHNHCNISYAHGSLDDAIKNAALRLDFASITGHASWPDMDEHDPRIQHIVQFHQRGFAKLHKNWDNYLERISKAETASIRSFYFQATRFIRMSMVTTPLLD